MKKASIGNDSDDDLFVKRPAIKRSAKKRPVKATNHIDLKSFIMVIDGNEAARALVSPHCIELIKKAVCILTYVWFV